MIMPVVAPIGGVKTASRGLSDEQQRLCAALAVWNGRDPILKERLFGLTNSEGNHGEDVKELYYYLDATPTHSWLRMLYKYPQREFVYERLVAEDRRRGKADPEFELLDSGVFDDDRYWDTFARDPGWQPSERARDLRRNASLIGRISLQRARRLGMMSEEEMDDGLPTDRELRRHRRYAFGRARGNEWLHRLVLLPAL
jgi:hypothetical protein